jgi:hypothetical protein
MLAPTARGTRVSIKVLTHLPDPDAPPSDWALAEARLATSQVHALLDEASSRLTRLAREVKLPPEIEQAVRETLQQVESGRETIGIARRYGSNR